MKKGGLFLCLFMLIGLSLNFISAETNNSFLSINLISWPENNGELYFNYTYGENETEDELPYQYNFTNSTDVDTCILYIDNITTAISINDVNESDFLNWWSDEEITIDSVEGNHTWQVYCNLTNGIYNYSEIRSFESFDYTKIKPDVWLTWPNNNQIFNNDYEIDFYFDYLNNSEIKNCSWYIDNTLISIWNTNTNNWTNIKNSSTSSGRHTWSYSCTNIHNRVGNSETRSFYRLDMDIIPSDLFLLYDNANNDLSNLEGFYIGSEFESGYIYFRNNVTLLNISLLNLVNISQNRIYLDSSNLSMLNKNATLRFNGITFSNPRILKDNVIVSIPFLYDDGSLTFNITGFSEYRIEETPVSPTSSGGSGGGGGSSGGGGGSSKKKTIVNQTIIKLTNPTNTNPNSEIPTNDTISDPSSITGAVTGINNTKTSKVVYISLIIIIFGTLIFILIRRGRRLRKRNNYY